MYTGLCHVVVAGLLMIEEGGRTLSAIKQILQLYNQEVDDKTQLIPSSVMAANAFAVYPI